MTTSLPCIVIILCSLLTVAASASAECAWVVWAGVKLGPTIDTTHWQPTIAYPNEAACQREATEARAKPVPGITWLCLPDTVDPRGPKGK